jgi:hypothetical protein
VSFGTPDHDGRALVEVDVRSDRLPLSHDCIHAVEVPLFVDGQGAALATISEEIQFSVPAGHYTLRFELGPGAEHDGVQHHFSIRLTFFLDPPPL